MKICGKTRKGKPTNTCAPRKRTKPTKAEAKLQKRIESFNATTRGMANPKGEGFTRPGSLNY